MSLTKGLVALPAVLALLEMIRLEMADGLELMA